MAAVDDGYELREQSFSQYLLLRGGVEVWTHEVKHSKTVDAAEQSLRRELNLQQAE